MVAHPFGREPGAALQRDGLSGAGNRAPHHERLAAHPREQPVRQHCRGGRDRVALPPMRTLPIAAGLLALTTATLLPAKPPIAKANLAPGMVSAADPRAAEAGAQILRQGGSALDAAFATLIALTVVEPQSSGIGGGGYMVYSPRGGPAVTFDGRETAPHAATNTWFFKDGQPMPTREAIPGGKSVGVPGNLRMMAL